MRLKWWRDPPFSVFTTTSPPDAPATEEPQAEEEIPLEKFGPVARPRSRNEIYPQHHDLFLTHSWRPSTAPGQVADIVVRLFHHPDGRLPKGFVEKVEYDLGPAWGGKLVRRNANQDFRLEISAYGSVLCVCTVYFSDGTDPIEIYRYLDFTP